MTLVPTNKSKQKTKQCQEVWIKTRDLIRRTTKSSDDYDAKYMKIKFNSDDQLPLNKTIENFSMTLVVRVIFYLK